MGLGTGTVPWRDDSSAPSSILLQHLCIVPFCKRSPPDTSKMFSTHQVTIVKIIMNKYATGGIRVHMLPYCERGSYNVWRV